METGTRWGKQHWLLFINATAPLFLSYFGWEPSECFSRGTFWNEHREQGLWVGHAPLRIRKEAAMVGSGFSFLWVRKENFFPWWPDSWVFIALCFWYLCAHADMWACVFVCVHLCAHVDRGLGCMLVFAYQEVSFWFLFFPPKACWNLIFLYRLIKYIKKRLSIFFKPRTMHVGCSVFFWDRLSHWFLGFTDC